MLWWSLLLWVVEKLIEWLLSAKKLTQSERERVDHFIYLSRQAERRACSLGCVQGGRLPG